MSSSHLFHLSVSLYPNLVCSPLLCLPPIFPHFVFLVLFVSSVIFLTSSVYLIFTLFSYTNTSLSVFDQCPPPLILSSCLLNLSLSVCVFIGMDVWWADGGHPMLQGRTYLQEIRPLQSSRWGQPGQGESWIVLVRVNVDTSSYFVRNVRDMLCRSIFISIADMLPVVHVSVQTFYDQMFYI